jgi:hypothetical protein
MRPWAQVLALALLESGCADAVAPSDRAGAPTGTLPASTAGLCSGTPTETKLAWEERSSLGISPRDAFEARAGSCEVPFLWESAGWSVTLTPTTADTQLIVSVQFDQESARVVSHPHCSDYLEIDADVRFETDDGVFAERSRVSVRHYKSAPAQPISLRRKSSELAGGLRVSLTPNQQLSFEFRSSGGGSACAGELTMSLSETHGNMGSNVLGAIGRWSNTGCPLNSEPLLLDDSSALGLAVKSEIEQFWSKATYVGRWEDGGETQVSLAVASDAVRVCAETSELRTIRVPVQLTYGTDDGRIPSHTIMAEMGLYPSDDDGISQAQILASETLTCAPGAQRLSVLDEDCRRFERVSLQLNANRYSYMPEIQAAIELYKYRQVSETGAADAVERLISHSRE